LGVVLEVYPPPSGYRGRFGLRAPGGGEFTVCADVVGPGLRAKVVDELLRCRLQAPHAGGERTV